MTRIFAGIALLALAACAPPVPDSGAGVGFGTPEEFRAQQAARDAALEASINDDSTASAVDAVIPGPPLSTAAPGAPGAPGAPAGTPEGTVATAPLGPDVERSGDISDEQNFDAVSGRETIESDAARIAANRQQYVVVQPTELPNRTDGAPNIVAYALATTNPVGAPLYRRSGFNAANRFSRNCAEFASADLAQQSFLATGGPERDRRGLDPDGDGFACTWDPTPFRAVAN